MTVTALAKNLVEKRKTHLRMLAGKMVDSRPQVPVNVSLPPMQVNVDQSQLLDLNATARSLVELFSSKDFAPSINVPQQPVPEIIVNVPEQPAPIVNVEVNIPPDAVKVMLEGMLPAPEVNITVPEQPTPIVTVQPAVVNVPAPVVNIAAPKVTVNPKIEIPQKEEKTPKQATIRHSDGSESKVTLK